MLGRIQHRTRTTLHLNEHLHVNPSCFQETMRTIVALLFAFLAVAFVAAYAAVEEEASDGDLSLSVNKDRDESSVDGGRVKRGTSMPKTHAGGKGGWSWGGCYCYYWYYGYCKFTKWGCFCFGNKGCAVYIWHNGRWKYSSTWHPGGNKCYCNHNTKRLRSYGL
ncbi:hypothetical protein LSAT2_002569 [Lamellibrachia satsuma]|nr:hypothetical protein LSAT2_002569 [Lamellibrachia satsuma]